MGKPRIQEEQVFTDFLDGSIRFIMVYDEQWRASQIRGENDSTKTAKFFVFQGTLQSPTARYPQTGQLSLVPGQTITWDLPGNIDPDEWNWTFSFIN